MTKRTLDKFLAIYQITNVIIAGLLCLYSFGFGIYKGINSQTISDTVGWIAIGVVGGFLILGSYAAINLGLIVWDESTSWLSRQIRKHPYLRLLFVFPSIFLSFYAAYLVLGNSGTDFSTKIFFCVYLIWILPAAITSLVRDDLRKESTFLSKKVSREMRIDNPQAAIANAFTHFEDHLNTRISGDARLYGDRLIKAAYSGENSKLVYKANGKDYTPHLHDLISGAYAVFRNPRSHVLVEDDEENAQAIIDLVLLLIKYVDESEDRVIPLEIDKKQTST